MGSDELKLGCDGPASSSGLGGGGGREVEIFQLPSRYTQIEKSSGLMSHLSRMQTYPARYRTITFSEVWLTVSSDDPFLPTF